MSMRMPCAAVAVVASLSGTALAQVVFVSASKDNTLYQDTAGSVSNGAGPNLFAGNNASSTRRRAVLAFDVASAVPAGSIITRVDLVLFMNQTSGGAVPVSLHRLLSNWGEGTSNAGGSGGSGAPSTPGDATWIHTFYNTSMWGSAGGDFVSLASATTSVDGIASYTWSTAGMIADVQMWADTPSTNFGWLIKGDESAASTAKRFGSRESGVTTRPELMIEFMPVPGPGGTALLAAAGLVAMRRRR